MHQRELFVLGITMSKYHSSFQGSIYIIRVDFQVRWNARCHVTGGSQEYLHIPCVSAVAAAWVWWHCKSSACLLQELRMLQAGFWLINTSKLPYSLGNVEIRAWPAGTWRKLNSCCTLQSQRGHGDPTGWVSSPCFFDFLGWKVKSALTFFPLSSPPNLNSVFC